MNNGAGAFWRAQQAAMNRNPLGKWLIVFNPKTRVQPLWVESREEAMRTPALDPKMGLLEVHDDGSSTWHDLTKESHASPNPEAAP